MGIVLLSLLGTRSDQQPIIRIMKLLFPLVVLALVAAVAQSKSVEVKSVNSGNQETEIGSADLMDMGHGHGIQKRDAGDDSGDLEDEDVVISVEQVVGRQ